jgi:glutamate synthase (NADPH) small chain
METTVERTLICPKCRQPIEGDEAYICCATATLSWRCTDCGKVSEGFAFPYGLCPLCSGKLELLNRNAVDDEEALDAVRMAFEIELGGQAFYGRAAAQTGEPLLQQLFEKFAAMEGEHIETLTRRYHADVPAPSADFQVERAAIFAGLESRPEDPGNLLRIAILFEQRAVDFFTEQCDRAPDGSVQKQLYKELAAEEREHVALLTTEYERWKLGKPGLL